MELKDINIGFTLTGSFCTFKKVIPKIKELKELGANILPIMGISTNDGLSGSAENIGKLLNRKNYYFVPFTQDNPITKPTSLVFKFDYLIPTIKEALDNKQLQPVIG